MASVGPAAMHSHEFGRGAGTWLLLIRSYCRGKRLQLTGPHSHGRDVGSSAKCTASFGIRCGRAQRIAFPEATSVFIGGAVCYKVHTLLLQSDADMLGAGPSE